MSKQTTRRLGSLGALLAVTAVALLGGAASSLAATGPKWKIESFSNTTVQPSSVFTYFVQATNVSGTPTNGEEIEMLATLAPGMKVREALGKEAGGAAGIPCTAGNGLDPVADATSVRCANTVAPGRWDALVFKIVVAVDGGVISGQTLESDFEVSGGGAALADDTKDRTAVTGSKPPFGIEAFDNELTDASGAVLTQAAAHPDAITTSIDFNTVSSPTQPIVQGSLWPVEPSRDISVSLPPGVLGNVSELPQCTLAQLSNGSDYSKPEPLCPLGSQVGLVAVHYFGVLIPLPSILTGQVVARPPLFNLDPPPGTPARFGLVFAGSLVVFDASVRSNGDYGLTVASHQTPEGLALAGSQITFWGAPASESHDSERACPGEPSPTAFGENGFNPSCIDENSPQVPILRTPTSCQGPQATVADMDSWTDPGALTADGFPDTSDPRWTTASSVSHKAPGYPESPGEWGEEVGFTGCDQVPFEPSISAQPTTNAADSPTGLNVDLRIPQGCWGPGEFESLCQSDLKDAEVTLPQGMSVNPSSATGLGACSPSQVGLTTPTGSSPIHFDVHPANCPDDAKIGTVEIETPLLDESLKGAVYLAKQSDNPFNSLLAMYLVAEGSGVVVKQAGEIRIGADGRLTTVFKDAPQTPFSKLHVELFGGPRAALKTPPSCGTYTTEAKLTPWARPDAPVSASSSFQVTNCPNSGFDPKLSAGTANPLAGAYSPFTLRLSREDGTQELAGLKLGLPQGLIANLSGIPYCSDETLNAIPTGLATGAAQIATPSCPAASQVGTVTVGAGAGPNPFYTRAGRAYWAGPYKGAPVSLAVVTPAVAGPFDLGNVVVRNRFEVDPETAKITAVADPFPTSLFGIPLDLRSVEVNLDRPNYTLNPTSCDPMAFDATIAGAQGASAQRTERFQVGACDRLGFKPKLSLRLKGGTKRSAHPALSATLTMPRGGANIAHASVALPHSEFLAQSHIKTICTRVQFAADQCPKGSVYGYARAYSPILDYYLQGPVYLRSSTHPLPDLVAALGGQIDVDLVGRIDSKNGGIRTTFATVPDAPVSKFTLTMQGGKKGLLENSRNLCRSTNRATVLFDAHNGKTRDLRPELKNDCGGKGGGSGKKKSRR